MSKRQVIWKFTNKVRFGGEFEIEASADAIPVLFGKQGSTWNIWMQVTPAMTQRKIFRFVMVGTGMRIPNDHKHIQSVQDGVYVWHLYQHEIS
jgi:hypothetical protein